jgi:deoxyribodipyrimidine photolyase-like uncharacterized protein
MQPCCLASQIQENQIFFNPSKKKYFQTSFYKLQRKKMNILMIGENPKGDKWTYDDENMRTSSDFSIFHC